jgi:anti-sigma28 factor (negative regulator of flagellin synthesis)
MKINGGNTGPVRPDATRDDRAAASDKAPTARKARRRVDTVEISDAGRAKAAEAAPNARSARLQDIRERILEGAYDTDEVVGEVARRILDRGDLQFVPSSEPR